MVSTDLVIVSMEILVTVVMDWVKILVPFGLGILLGIIVRKWEINRMQPLIVFQGPYGSSPVRVVPIDLKDETGKPHSFQAYRISVINIGRSGARDCKAYFQIGMSRGILPDDAERMVYRRTAWMLPDDNTALSVTLNVNIAEYIDLCAFNKELGLVIVTTERGYKANTISSCHTYSYSEHFPMAARLIVSSSNAQPAGASCDIRASADGVTVDLPNWKYVGFKNRHF